MRIALLFWGLILSYQSISQLAISFDENGKLSTVKQATGAIKVTLPSDADKQAEAKKTISNKCIKAAGLLSDPNALLFFREIWNDSEIDQIKAELLAIGNDAVSNQAYFAYLYEMLPYLPFSDSVYRYTTKGHKVSLTFYNLINRFLLNYHQLCLSDPENLSVKNLGIRDFAAYGDFLVANYRTLSQELEQARRQVNEKSRLQLESARMFRSDPLYSGLLSLMNAPWFKQWIWYTEGIVRVNPFEFATATYFQKYPQNDISRTGIYQEYIDSLLRRRIRLDSLEKLDEVKKLLLAKGNSNREFSNLDRIEKIKAENSAALKELTTISQLLNECSFPLDNKLAVTPHLYYFADQETKGNMLGLQEQGLLEITEQKTIAVHNIPSQVKIVVRESTTPFADLSEFRRFTDDFTGQATSLIPALQHASTLVSTASTALQSRTSPVPVRILPLTKGMQTSYFSANYGRDWGRVQSNAIIKDAFKRMLQDSGYYNQDVFERRLLIAYPDFEVELSSIRSLNDQKVTILLKQYLDVYTRFYNESLDEGRKDSTILYYFSNAFINSSLPISSLKPTQNTKPIYTSLIRTTSTYDEPVENSVRLVALQDKDSLTITSFKYKMAKRYKFQVTAGIAASFPAPLKNELKLNDGTYTVEQEAESVRVQAGVNFYIFSKGLLLQSKGIGFTPDRFSFFVGVGIPKPLENIYTGLSWDIIPSIRFTGGAHWHNLTEFEIKNGQLAKESNEYKPHPFVGIGIDPISFIKIFNLFK